VELKGPEGNAASLTALGVFGAPEDAGGPRLVGRRPVALRQHLPALAALPALQLYRTVQYSHGTAPDIRSGPNKQLQQQATAENRESREERRDRPAGRRRAG
jgi:hypothetical protein